MRSLTRTVAVLASSCFLTVALPAPAHAALVGTQQVVQSASGARDHVQAWLARGDVRDALAAGGVEPAQVQARVAAMSDAEVADLAQRIDQAPAGGDILGILFAVFVILLITDILGLTKVFPFTRPVR